MSFVFSTSLITYGVRFFYVPLPSFSSTTQFVEILPHIVLNTFYINWEFFEIVCPLQKKLSDLQLRRSFGSRGFLVEV